MMFEFEKDKDKDNEGLHTYAEYIVLCSVYCELEVIVHLCSKLQNMYSNLPLPIIRLIYAAR